MKRIVVLTGLLVSVLPSLSAANHHAEFSKLLKAGDTLKVRNLLVKWEKEEPKSADLASGWFNYYYWQGKSEMLGQMAVSSVDSIPAGITQYMPFADSTGNMVGIMYPIVSCCKDSIDMAFKKIDVGIANNPQRLDLHFGRVHVMHELVNVPAVSVCGHSASNSWDNKPTLSDVVDYLCKLVDTPDHSKWKWSNDEQVEDSENFFFDNMQSYFTEIVSDESVDISLAEKFVDKLLSKKQTLEFRSDKASLLAARKEYDKALDRFLGILKDYPDDDIVISNIASCYEHKGDVKNAITYYKKLEKSKNKQASQFAKDAIKDLKSKK